MYYGNISTVSNREDWQEAIVVTDDDSGDLIDISLCRITMTVIHKPKNPNVYAEGYYYDYPIPVGALLTGSTDTGEITLPAVGTFQWLFPASRMNQLRQGEYLLGIRISQAPTPGATPRIVQLIIGSITVLEGIDNQ